jgi:chromosome segregation ATPase
LRDSLADANKQISSLKDVNENIRKRNEKGTIKEKELEDELNILKERFSALAKKEADLQKQYNITSTELNSSKANYTKLDSEGKKLRAELEAARNTIKMKEDLITKS